MSIDCGGLIFGNFMTFQPCVILPKHMVLSVASRLIDEILEFLNPSISRCIEHMVMWSSWH